MLQFDINHAFEHREGFSLIFQLFNHVFEHREVVSSIAI